MFLSKLDIVIICVYLAIMAVIGLLFSFRKNGANKGVSDYFLAGKSLPWWAIGGSLIASNISAEQFIGMSGSGFVVGMAIASYEFMAAATLLVVAKFFLPVFLEKGIYTMPQFLERRFDTRVKTVMAIFWVTFFVFINITSVLYLGALAIRTMTGIPLILGVIVLSLYAASFSIFGGLRTVVMTDMIQVVVLIVGGTIASILILNQVGDGILGGLINLWQQAPEKFDMILSSGHPEYINLPGVSVLIGGMWIANLYYWGNNQYIIQRALGAENLKEAQKGVVFAAFIKLILPLIVVVPGIAAFVLNADINKPDEAFPWVLNHYVSSGFKGLTFAALVAAIGSSLSSMVNSASTIFSLDIVKPLLNNRLKNPDVELVTIGKWSAAISLLIGTFIAPTLINLEQTLQFIQEYTGFISPGVVCIFLFGLFWQRSSANAALVVVLLSIPLSAFIKFKLPTLPFIDRMGVSFLILSAIMISISILQNKGADEKHLALTPSLFYTSKSFNISSIIIIMILLVLYASLW